MADLGSVSVPEVAQLEGSVEGTAQSRPSGQWHRLPGWSGWALGALTVVAMFGLQGMIHPGQERTIATVFMFVALAEAWNIIGGFCGYACFGQVLFFGVGGYTTAVLMAHDHLSFWAALPISATVAGLYGVVTGVLLLRLRGHYFAIATLGVAEGTREVVTNLTSLTGGGAGITIPTVGTQAVTRYPGNNGFYVLFLLAAVVAVGAVAVLARSRFGYSLRAINQDEDAAASAGIDTTRAKVMALAASAVLTGMVGSIYAFQQASIYPERLFDVNITVLMIIMVVIGGSGTVVGPVVGAVSLQFLSEYLRQHYANAHTFILGAIIIVAVVLVPQGVVNFSREAWRARRLSLLDNIRTYRL